MKNTLLLFSLLFCLSAHTSFAQQSRAERLLVDVQRQPASAALVDTLVDRAWEINFDEPDEAQKLLEAALVMAKQLNYEKGVGNVLSGMGTVADIQNNLQQALDYHQQALTIRQKSKDLSAIAGTYTNIGNVLESMGKKYEAIDNHHKGIQILREIKDSVRLARAEVNIAGVYESLGIYITATEHIQEARYLFEARHDEANLASVYNTLGHIWYENEKFDAALPLYRQALALYEKNRDTAGIASTLGNLANAYDEWGNSKNLPDTTKKATPLYLKALDLYKYLDDSSGIAKTYNNLGIMCKHMGLYQKGLEYLNNAYRIRVHLDETAGVMEVYNSYGDIYFGLKKYKTSLEYTQKYFDIALQLRDEKYEQKAYKDFSKVFAAMGDFVKAYKYRVMYDEMRYRRLDENRSREFIRREQMYADRKKEDALKRRELELAQKDAVLSRNRATRNGLIGGVVALLLLTALFYTRARLRARSNQQLAAKNATIERARKRADELLMNILPEAAAAELKLNNSVKPVRYESVTVVFTDFKGFTKIAELVSPEELIAELDMCFRAFDAIMERFGLEKIKTIGDSYMCAGGLPVENNTHALNAVEAAIEMQRELKRLMAIKAAEGKPVFEMRIGIHTGPVVAGVVGSHKFAYDIWGDTVNIASRIEQASEPTRINISSATYDLIKHKYHCEQRGLVAAKNKGSIEMYFVHYED